MRKLTILLAVLMLFLQVFSGTVAYAAEGDNIFVLGYEIVSGDAPITEGEAFTIKLRVMNRQGENTLSDIFVNVDTTSSFYGNPASGISFEEDIGPGNEEKITLPELVYKGTGHELFLTFTYKNDGTDCTETESVYIGDAVPTDSKPPQSNTDQYAPKLIVENAGIMQSINAGGKHQIKFNINNISNFAAKNISLSLTMDDLNTAPKLLRNFVLRQTLSDINANEAKEAVFSLESLPTAPEGVYKFILGIEYENSFANTFPALSIPVYVKVVNNNTKPILSVNDITVRQSETTDAIVLDLTLQNIGRLKADDVKVTLGGLRSGGFTAYNSTDVRYIDTIYGNGTATVSYELLPPSSGAAGSNELSVKFEYRDSAGNSYTEQNQIFVPAGEGEGSRPNVAFEQITAPQAALGVGNEFNISFALKNSGGAAAKNIKVTLNTDAGIVIRSMNPVYLTDLGANKSEKISYSLFAADEAVTKNYPISLNVEYEDAFGNKYNATQYVGVFVENDAGKTVPRIIIDNYSMDPFPVNAGEEIKLKMSFLNTSKTIDVSNIKVTVTSEDGTFTPTDSGNTFFIERIPMTENVERELALQVKPDAEQKSYMLTVNFEYEDEKGNPFTAKETMSVRVLQSPRLVTGQVNMMTETFVGQPVSVYMDFYNMGKSTLYNLMVSVEGEFQGQGLSYYVGNFEPGRTDYFDASFSPMNPGMQKGSVLFTFEDANGKTSEVRKEFELNVMEMMQQEPILDEFGNPIDMGMGKPGMDMPGMPGMPGGRPAAVSIWVYIGIGAAVLAAAVVVFIILRKRSIRRRELSLDE